MNVCAHAYNSPLGPTEGDRVKAEISRAPLFVDIVIVIDLELRVVFSACVRHTRILYTVHVGSLC